MWDKSQWLLIKLSLGLMNLAHFNKLPTAPGPLQAQATVSNPPLGAILAKQKFSNFTGKQFGCISLCVFCMTDRQAVTDTE